jgi:hypothetical protein
MTIQRTFDCAVCIKCTLLLPSGYSQLGKGKGQQSLGVGYVVKGKDKFQLFRTFWSHIHLNAKMIKENAAFSKRVLSHVNIEYPQEENTCGVWIHITSMASFLNQVV